VGRAGDPPSPRVPARTAEIVPDGDDLMASMGEQFGVGRLMAGAVVIASLALCIALPTGCSNPRAEVDRRLPTDVVVRPVTSAKMATLPLYNYLLAFHDQYLVERAVGMIAGKCMRRYGLRTHFTILGGYVIARPRVLVVINWLPVASAERYGYRKPVTIQQREALRFNRSMIRAMNEGGRSSRSVLLGLTRNYRQGRVPVGGCLRDAERVLVRPLLLDRGQRKGIAYGIRAETKRQMATPDAIYEDLMGQGASLPKMLILKAAARMMADPRLAETTKRWRLCMLRSGFDYRSPTDAASDPRWNAFASDASLRRTRPLQVQVATADARCEARVDYAGMRLALLRGYEDRLINDHKWQLTAYRMADKTAHRPGKTCSRRRILTVNC
jgi:hypothetical protein